MSAPSNPVSGSEVAAEPPRTLPSFITAPRHEARRIRWIVAGVLAALLVLMIFRLSLVTGWWRAVRIEGPSMAETFLGAHYEVNCDDCGIVFPCDATGERRVTRAVCPNCGYRNNQLTEDQLRPGERMLIDRWQLPGHVPARGEVIAIRGDSGELRTKRVVAAPGERWGIRDGDLYINDELSRKTFAQFLDQSILVHDNNHQPTRSRDLPQRWRSEQQPTNWKAEGSGFTYAPEESTPSAKQIDWLEYTQWRCTDALGDRCDPSPVFDNDAYNQGLNRNLNWQSDIALSCSVACETDGRFALVAVDDPHRFEIVFDRSQRSVVLTDTESEETVGSAERTFADAHRLDILIVLCDQQVFVAEGGQLLITHRYRRMEPCENLKPLGIGGNRGRLKVTNLKVYRDVYYLDPAGTGRPWNASAPLKPGHIAVLGDNPPVSLDSREDDDGLPISQVLGSVYRPFGSLPAKLARP